MFSSRLQEKLAKKRTGDQRHGDRCRVQKTIPIEIGQLRKAAIACTDCGHLSPILSVSAPYTGPFSIFRAPHRRSDRGIHPEYGKSWAVFSITLKKRPLNRGDRMF